MQPKVFKSEVEYAAYAKNISKVNLTHEYDAKLSPVSLNNFKKPEMLHSLGVLREIIESRME